MLVKDLLNDPSRWTQFFFARNGVGTPVWPEDGTAVCWCLLGAIHKCYEERTCGVIELVQKELNYVSVAKWNNAPERTFEDVKNLVTRLNI